VAKHMLGYIPDPVDNRDWQWRTLYGAAANLPARVSLESLPGPAYDQGKTSECVCYSLAGLKHLHEWAESGRWLGFDAHDLYTRCKAIDGVASPGTYPRVALDILQREGMRADDGALYTISGYARLGAVDEIRHALSSGFPVLIGLPIPDGLGALTQGQIADGAPSQYGHAMLAVGYDDDLRALRVRNSWGTAWCDAGHFWLAFDYVASRTTFDAWTAVDAQEVG